MPEDAERPLSVDQIASFLGHERMRSLRERALCEAGIAEVDGVFHSSDRTTRWFAGDAGTGKTVVLIERLGNELVYEEFLRSELKSAADAISGSSSRPARPMRFLVRAITRHNDELVDVLEERFAEVVDDLGPRYAQAWYMCQIVRLAWPALATFWCWATKVGLFAFAARGCR